jgi:hypothetical protein
VLDKFLRIKEQLSVHHREESTALAQSCTHVIRCFRSARVATKAAMTSQKVMLERGEVVVIDLPLASAFSLYGRNEN